MSERVGDSPVVPDDEAVRAVVDEVARKRAERLEVDGAVLLEGRDDCGQDLTQHVWILRAEGGYAMIKGFRDFLMRGNLVELAVLALIMGLAFAALAPRSWAT